MDKSWITLRRRASPEYAKGVMDFIEFAFARSSVDGKIVCPCVKCVFTRRVSKSDAVDHLICDGFLKGYVRWIFHGEASDASSSTSGANEEEKELGHDDSHDLLPDRKTEGAMNVDAGSAAKVSLCGSNQSSDSSAAINQPTNNEHDAAV